MPQIGRVLIDDDVEIGANSAVDRGALKDTIIGRGTKIDNLVQIGHNVIVGRNCVLVAQVAIAGSTELGDFVVMGGQSGAGGTYQARHGCSDRGYLGRQGQRSARRTVGGHSGATVAGVCAGDGGDQDVVEAQEGLRRPGLAANQWRLDSVSDVRRFDGRMPMAS